MSRKFQIIMIDTDEISGHQDSVECFVGVDQAVEVYEKTGINPYYQVMHECNRHLNEDTGKEEILKLPV